MRFVGLNNPFNMGGAGFARVDHGINNNAPDWVPKGALVYCDFFNDRYWANGQLFSFHDFFVASAAWNPTPNSPVVGEGLDGNQGSVFNGYLLAQALAGSTIVLEGNRTVQELDLEFFDTPDYAIFDIDLDAQSGINDYILQNTIAMDSNNAIKIAVTVIEGHVAMSACGSEPVTYPLPESLSLATAVGMGSNSGSDDTGRLTSLTLYPPKNDWELPELSAPIPANARIHIDFVNNFGWTDRHGVVAIGSLIGGDHNTDNGWGASAYISSALISSGLDMSALPNKLIAFIGPALDKMLAGATTVVNATTGNTDATQISIALLSADGNNAMEADFGGGLIDVNSYGVLSFEDEAINTNNGVVGVSNAIAVSIDSSNGRLEIAGNGYADHVIAQTVSADERANMVAAVVASAGTCIIKSITIYDLLPTIAGLALLSEINVVNTAPTDVTIQWFGLTANGTFTHTDAITNATDLASLTLVDPEGNPGTYTFIDDDGGNFTVTNTGQLRGPLDGLSVGDHTFTLRAADPYGLYVDKTFTVTITAIDPPVLSNLIIIGVFASQVNFSVDSDAVSTLFGIISTSDTPPTPHQIHLGLDADDNPAIVVYPVTLPIGTTTYGMESALIHASTVYWLHVVAAGYSNVLSETFTTTA